MNATQTVVLPDGQEVPAMPCPCGNGQCGECDDRGMCPADCENCGERPGTTEVKAYREERVNVCDFKKVTLAECWCDECVRDYPAEFTEE